MAGALWSVADASGEQALRERAFTTREFVLANFADPSAGGFFDIGAASGAGVFARSEKRVADNARFARLILRRARLAHDLALEDVSVSRRTGALSLLQSRLLYAARRSSGVHRAIASFVTSAREP